MFGLYEFFNNSLRPFNIERRNLSLLIICLPKLLPDAKCVLEEQRGETNRLAKARHGAHREIHVGHFFVRARQLTSQAC